MMGGQNKVHQIQHVKSQENIAIGQQEKSKLKSSMGLGSKMKLKREMSKISQISKQDAFVGRSKKKEESDG